MSVPLCFAVLANEPINVSHVVQSIGGPYNAVADVQQDVQSLLNELIADNNLATENIPVLIANNSGSNALASGDLIIGTIVINRGLLALVSDLQQLRAALAHELAHLHRKDRGGHRRLIIERRADELAAKWLGETAGLRSLLGRLSATTDLDRAQHHFSARQQYLTASSYTPTGLPLSIQRLQAKEHAYPRYRRILAKLSNGNNVSAEAIELTNEVPSEAKFWLLLGDSLSSTPPCKFYVAAVDKNPEWFLPWLKLGECQSEQGSSAALALQNSIKLLPTPQARRLLSKQLRED